MFKKEFFYVALIVISLGGVGCSSNSGSGEDLDISEIQEIEATGEFSEDEFFSDEVTTDVAEEELVDEVPGLEAELEGEVARVENELDGSSGDFDVDIAGDTTDGSEGDNLSFDDLALDDDIAVEEGPDKQNVTVTADDLGFEDELDLEDEVASLEGDVNGASDELELDSEDDLFRDDDLGEVPAVATTDEFDQTDALTEDVSIDNDYSDQVASNNGAADLLEEDVSINDDYANEVTNDKSAAELLADDVSIDVDYSTPAASSAPKGLVSVKKMKTVPYSKNGVLVNAIYFVRQGDSLRTIADRIYGEGSAVDFRMVNSHLKKGALKVGQKVYYNSPTRAQDRSRLLTYYEDVRMPAQMYSAQEGENIRTISKSLLGHSRSWMEVWATNQQIESKAGLEAPYQIRYWNGTAPPAPAVPTLAQNDTPAPAPVEPALEEELPESTSQASLDLGDDMEEPIEDLAAIDEPVMEDPIEEPDMELDTPAEPTDVAMNDDGFEMDEADLMGEVEAEDPVAEAGMDEEVGAVAAVEGRNIARNNGAFPAKSSGGIMGNDTMRMGIIGVALLLLLAVGFLVVKRRRESQNAVDMESFDFGGETTIEEAQTKTQIDL